MQRVIQGYGAVFGSDSVNLGGFIERIDPGAFRGSLRGDVRLLVGHDDAGVPLARTAAGTLELRTDSKGLWFSATLPDSEPGRALHLAIKRGDLSGMSFGFHVKRDAWELRDVGPGLPRIPVRTLLDVHVTEISAVAWPAYPATRVWAVEPEAPPRAGAAAAAGGHAARMAELVTRKAKLRADRIRHPVTAADWALRDAACRLVGGARWDDIQRLKRGRG